MRNPFRNPDESANYPKSASDRQHLVASCSTDEAISFGPNTPCSIMKRHKHCTSALFIVLVVVACLATGIYFYRIRCSPTNCVQLKVMSLNTWGMPEKFGSKYKSERMKAIADEVSKGQYDLYLLQELWMQADHETVKAGLPEGFHMTEFRELALSTCDGRIAPSFCSGLSIISRLPFNETEFNSYTYHGNALNALTDGEWLARKGVGRVRIHPAGDVAIDVFVTHTAADPDPSYNYNNEWYRQKQVEELIQSYLNKSTADVMLLGGDFNAGPDSKEGSPYEMLRRFMTNCIEEIFYKANEWMDAKFATYGNLQNTFSGNVYDPIIYDYIFYKTNTDRVTAHTNLFELVFLKTKLLIDSLIDSMDNNNNVGVDDKVIVDDSAITTTTTEASTTSTSTESSTAGSRSKREAQSKEKVISFSDHEAVTSTIYVRF